MRARPIRAWFIAATAAVGAGALLAPAARAVVGGRAEDGAAKRFAVMVLGSAGNVCSGIVVAPTAVLTAAHCVTNAAEHRVHYKDAAGQPVLIAPTAIAVHPGYDKGAIKGRRRSIDLALLRLPAPLPAPFVSAALTAAAGPPRAGARLVLAGYGVAEEGRAVTSGSWREADLTVVEPHGPGTILVWAADPAGLGKRAGAGACEGDSGGPLFAGGAVVAVTTWTKGPAGKTCGLLTQGVLVGPQRGFIDRTLAAWGASARWSE